MPQQNEKARPVTGQVAQWYLFFILDTRQLYRNIFHTGTGFKFGILWYGESRIVDGGQETVPFFLYA